MAMTIAKKQERPIVMVTGANGGIGSAIVDVFLENEFIVISCNRKNKDETLRTNVHEFVYDVTDVKATQQALDSIRYNFRRLDVAINNAGVVQNSLLGMTDDETIHNVIATNTISVIQHMRSQSRMMLPGKHGSIINVASIVGMDGNSGQVTYAASKAAVIAATKSAALELAPFGIRVNAVAPGLIDTNMLRSVKQDKLQAMLTRIPFKRFGKPHEVAQVIYFLASDAASYVTGQTWRIDGGFSI